MQIKLVNILTYVQIISYKNGMRYNMKGRCWQKRLTATSRKPVLSNRRVITNGAYALYIYVNMVQFIGVFCTSSAVNAQLAYW